MGFDETIINTIKKLYSSAYLSVNPRETPIAINRGLLQGSIISPILFNLYIDDLIRELDRKVYATLAYADDIANVCQDMQELTTAIQIVEKWGTKNRILVNKNKSGIFIFMNKRMGCSEIREYPVVYHYKYLGIMFRYDMDPFDHLVKLDKALVLYIKRNNWLIKKYFTVRSLILLSTYFQMSRIGYGMCLFLHDPRIIQKIERIRMRFIKSVIGVKDNTSSNRFRLALNIPLFEHDLFIRLHKVVQKYRDRFNEEPHLVLPILDKFIKDLKISPGDDKQVMKAKALSNSNKYLAELEGIELGEDHALVTGKYLYTWADKRDHFVLKYIINFGFFNVRYRNTCELCNETSSRTHITNECRYFEPIRKVFNHRLSKEFGFKNDVIDIEAFILRNYFCKVEVKNGLKLWNEIIKKFIVMIYFKKVNENELEECIKQERLKDKNKRRTRITSNRNKHNTNPRNHNRSKDKPHPSKLKDDNIKKDLLEDVQEIIQDDFESTEVSYTIPLHRI
jgi:hypothetical protein